MKESDLYSVSLNYHFQLEHVMPQMWNEFWGVSVLPVTDKDGNVVDDEHARAIRGQAVRAPENPAAKGRASAHSFS